MDLQIQYQKSIQTAIPDLDIRDARLVSGQNQFNDVLIVNDQTVFRFPRTEDGVGQLIREFALLRVLKNRLPIPIPDPVYEHLEDAGAGEAFMAYPLLPGEPFSRKTFGSDAPEEYLHRAVVQMGDFIHVLHGIEPESLGIDLPVRDTREEWSGLYADIRELLFPHMRPDAVEWARRLFDNFLDDETNFAYRPVLRHGDLGASNILFDSGTGSVSGVLDFSSAALGDPAVDVAGLASISEAFFSALYGSRKAEIGPLMHRAQFYKSTFALQEALFGARMEDQAAFQRGLAPYLPLDPQVLAQTTNPRTA